jgi:hypothetical protein
VITYLIQRLISPLTVWATRSLLVIIQLPLGDYITLHRPDVGIGRAVSEQRQALRQEAGSTSPC